MVSLQQSDSSSPGRFQITRPYYTPPSSAASSPSSFQKHLGRSMCTVRSSFSHSGYTNNSGSSFAASAEQEQTLPPSVELDNVTDSFIDTHLQQLATAKLSNSSSSVTSSDGYYGLSQVFSDFSACSSDISGELQRLASTSVEVKNLTETDRKNLQEPEPCLGFLQRENFSTEIIENISPEDLQPTVKIFVDSLSSSSIAVKRSAAAKIRLLAKNRADNRALIGESGAVPALIPLLRCVDPCTQEHVVTALLNLSFEIFIYVLKTGTEVSKQNAACALLSLAMVERVFIEEDEVKKQGLGFYL
ncbi:putative armadillo-like helical protein [Helianthus annuus]|uniref:Armadillo-like helical protein n=1 Tax=Helianthus annuus TaxID=4232 RepID=A0A251UVB4_HELAN|nr:putative armadillo-like helical protein [Helianthus annuus]KAJ0586367.1 putative armadillo-like helical protein [Helianthus annuus]KAJ0595131.1 putative armadillo-like helical protein [Helianthus annuus]KAJ0755816.1 putative armadillo-like helical protein [Helianthus annuus]KAJ0759596.1 putative armadillo-like helical protein [Helianthus annuus]